MKPSSTQLLRFSKRKSPDELAHMNIYVREPSKDGRRKKPRRYRFPVARYERTRFRTSHVLSLSQLPHCSHLLLSARFGPLVSFLPWVPIFVDRLTKQTIIYSPTGGGKTSRFASHHRLVSSFSVHHPTTHQLLRPPHPRRQTDRLRLRELGELWCSTATRC